MGDEDRWGRKEGGGTGLFGSSHSIPSPPTKAELAQKHQRQQSAKYDCIFRSIPPGDSVFIRPLIPL